MTKPATPIEQERARLDDALDRLDAAVKAVTARTQTQLGQLKSEREKLAADLAAAQSEQERTAQKLASATADNADLERAMGEVTARIDATIQQLKNALEE